MLEEAAETNKRLRLKQRYTTFINGYDMGESELHRRGDNRRGHRS